MTSKGFSILSLYWSLWRSMSNMLVRLACFLLRRTLIAFCLGVIGDCPGLTFSLLALLAVFRSWAWAMSFMFILRRNTDIFSIILHCLTDLHFYMILKTIYNITQLATILITAYHIVAHHIISPQLLSFEWIINLVIPLCLATLRTHYLPLFLSLSLVFALYPNIAFAGVYLLKIYEVNRVLTEIGRQVSAKSVAFVVAAYQCFSLSLVGYFFLGLLLFVSRQLKGQVESQSRCHAPLGIISWDAQFILGALSIPVMCISFLLYIRAINQTIKTYNRTKKNLNPTKSLLYQKEYDLLAFDKWVQAKQQQNGQVGNHGGDDHWIIKAASQIEQQSPLINQIVPPLQDWATNELRLSISSKISCRYFPMNWTIMKTGQFCQLLMMIEEGTVKQIREVSVEAKEELEQKRGFVFNKGGFLVKSPSRRTYRTATAVKLWVLRLSELEKIGQTNMKFMSSLNNQVDKLMKR